MNRNWLVPALGAALGVSCSTPTDLSPTQLNLDRPVDIAFACYGNMRLTTGASAGQVITTAQPATSCDTRSPKLATDPQAPPPGQEGDDVGVPFWYGFILQSASGTVALATWPAKPSYDPAGGATSAFTGGDVQVLDADKLTPGKNAISIGEDPIAIATDTSGCYEVTANAGSCDLSVLDINSALGRVAAGGDQSSPVRIERRSVTSLPPDQNTPGTPILARPAAMVATPNTTVVGNACPATANGLVYIAYPSCHLVAAVDTASGVIKSGIQYDGDVPRLLTTDADLKNVKCPDECPNPMSTSGSGPVTAGARPVTLDLKVSPDLSSGGGASTMRLVIGAQNSAKVTVVELDPTTSLPLAPQTPAQFALQEEGKTGTLGVTAVALSPQIPMGNPPASAGAPPVGGFGQYVYAVATDGTVRVIDVLTVNKECDTQVDTRLVRNPPGGGAFPTTRLQCFPVGDPSTPQRRVGARGPGIELIGDGVPTSVAIIKGLDQPLTMTSTMTNPDGSPILEPVTPTPSTLIGYFAIITATDGKVFVVNIDDDNAPDNYSSKDPLTTTPALVMAHQLRDSFSERGAAATKSVTSTITDVNGKPMQVTVDQRSCLLSDPDATLGGTNAGGPRITAAPVALVTGGPIDTSKVPELPTLHQLLCTGYDGPPDPNDPTMASATKVPSVISELQFGAPVTPVNVRDQVYPDLRSLTNDELWSLTWEGPLSEDTPTSAVDGPLVRSAKMVVDATGTGMHLFDETRPFCTMGVEPFDIVNFRGCNPANGDADCPAGYACFVHPDSKIAIGSCMLKNEASRLANACRDFLISARHYTVFAAQSGELQLLPRKHELRTTPVDGCISDAQCQQLANYAVQNGSPNLGDLAPNGMNLDPHTWQCMADDARKPINTDPTKNMRCVQTCAYHADPAERDKDCDASTICQGATPTSPGICMEGVTPPQACVNGPQRFEVRASEAFTVVGSRSGYIHPIVDRSQIMGGTDHTCVSDPAASPLKVGRIPLKAPACGDPAMTDPITGALTGGGFEANPCSLTVPQAEVQRQYPNLACTTPGCDPCANPMDVLVPSGDDPKATNYRPPRNAPAIQFRNPGLKLTLVDPTYPGDRSCVRDRQGVPGGLPSDRIPLVFQGYALSFEQKAGFSPLTLPTITPAFPVKVVRGPTDSIWVIDDGDTLNSSTAATRGQVFRVESTQLQVINTLQ